MKKNPELGPFFKNFDSSSVSERKRKILSDSIVTLPIRGHLHAKLDESDFQTLTPLLFHIF